MATSDLDSVLRNERQSYSHPWSEAAFRDCLCGPSECWLAIGEEDTIVGHVVLSVVIDEGHLLNICIGREWQGQGWSHLLIDFVLERFRKQFVDTAFLEVRVSNRQAIMLYQRYGFRVVGKRDNYYPAGSSREDAIIMSRAVSIDTSI